MSDALKESGLDLSTHMNIFFSLQCFKINSKNIFFDAFPPFSDLPFVDMLSQCYSLIKRLCCGIFVGLSVKENSGV